MLHKVAQPVDRGEKAVKLGLPLVEVVVAAQHRGGVLAFLLDRVVLVPADDGEGVPVAQRGGQFVEAPVQAAGGRLLRHVQDEDDVVNFGEGLDGFLVEVADDGAEGPLDEFDDSGGR